ncbi:type VI secretion protein [Rubrivivax gelatinosus]|nr:type VI secretion protein [Rubrivivax gelatinosus]
MPAPVRAQAAASGYGNAFEALRANVPWRPWRWDDSGVLLNPRPQAPGLQTATVVGPEGDAASAEEIHTDRLGRVRVRFPWQDGEHRAADTSRSSTWVRVIQRWAGAGHGVQWIPRIGQEVLVGFVEGDIDRPIVQGALYNGRGEAGVPATPGGAQTEADLAPLAASSDHAPGAQGNLTSGHSPAWHGAGPGEATEGQNAQNNAAALSGFKTREFGGIGFNQLVFDDSDSQLRVQLATTQHATQLNLGHLVHQADNHRGSFRGLGFELRTDAWGAIRAAQGILLTTYGQPEAAPAGDNAAGLALVKQLATLIKTFSDAAKTHQATQLAANIGSFEAGKAAISDSEAPAQAMLTSLKGMVADASLDEALGDAAAKSTRTAEGKLPHMADPMVAISAKAGLGIVAGQDLQMSAGETLTLAAGQNLEQASGGALRIHTGQNIGVLAGAVKPGEQAAGKGITLIAGQGDISVQAQSDTMRVAAKQDVSIQSASAHVDWAAAKKIHFATAGGARITLEGGNIIVECPGKISVWAGKKSFTGPQQASYAMPQMPSQVCVACLLKALKSGSALASV